MTGDEAFRRWAPPGAPWSAWAKPVLFAHVDEFEIEPGPVDPAPAWLEAELLGPLADEGASAAPGHPYRQARRLVDVALVVDLPGADGVTAGVALARHGFQPVPLYNALPAPAAMVVDQRPIMRALLGAAAALPTPPDGAPPAFLLDARRMNPDFEPVAGAFDNRSVSFASDFPSAAKLAGAGVRRAVLVQEEGARPAIDLGEPLDLWRRGGIEIFVKQASLRGPPAPCPAPRASLLSRAAHWFDTWQLGRWGDGSFGIRLPPLPSNERGGGG